MFAPLREPADFPFVARKHNWTAHPVSDRVRITVREVRPTLALFVSDKGNGMIIRAERRARQNKTEHRSVERLTQCFAPMTSIRCMMEFVQDYESRPCSAASLEHLGREGHLLVGHDRSVIVPCLPRLLIGRSGLQMQAARSC